MDNRIFYPDHFYAHSTTPGSTVMVLAWPERNGFGWQPLKDVATDMPANFYYDYDFKRYWRQCTEEEDKKARDMVEAFITERDGPQHEVPHYTYTQRNFWS